LGLLHIFDFGFLFKCDQFFIEMYKKCQAANKANVIHLRISSILQYSRYQITGPIHCNKRKPANTNWSPYMQGIYNWTKLCPFTVTIS